MPNFHGVLKSLANYLSCKGKHSLEAVDCIMIPYKLGGGRWVTLYRCRKCGHEETKP
jgi:hypothetical protein